LTVTRSRSCSCVLSFRNCGGSSDGALQLTKSAFVAANGCPIPQYFEADSVIETSATPSQSWIPLDDEAKAAAEKARRDFEVAANGCQVIDRKTGSGMVTRHGDELPSVVPTKPGAPTGKARVAKPDPDLLPGEGARRDPDYGRRHELPTDDPAPHLKLPSFRKRGGDEAA
jgi:hypothetical protein